MIICNSKALAYFFVVLGCGVLKEVSSLRCYECTESEPNLCGERFDKSNVTITDCRSSIYTIDTTTNEEKVYACLFIKETDVTSRFTFTRRCSIKNLNDTCENIIAKNQAAGNNIRTSCRQCENDLCNSSTRLNSNFGVSILFISFVISRI